MTQAELTALVERLRTAASDGEILTVVYSGGHSPGARRRILPVRVAGHLLYARSNASSPIKTYHLDGLTVVGEDCAAPWVDESTVGRDRATIIADPKIYFESWEFRIEKASWPALGVTLREYVDLEKARVLRLEAKQSGRQYHAPKYLAFAKANPCAFDFQEGDIFYSVKEPLRAVQVVARRKLIEVHLIFLSLAMESDSNLLARTAYHIIEDELAEWLETGITPDHGLIDAAQSYSDVLRFSISSRELGSATRS